MPFSLLSCTSSPLYKKKTTHILTYERKVKIWYQQNCFKAPVSFTTARVKVAFLIFIFFFFFLFFFFFFFFFFLLFDPVFFPPFSLPPFSFALSCAFGMLGHLSRAWLMLTGLHYDGTTVNRTFLVRKFDHFFFLTSEAFRALSWHAREVVFILLFSHILPY